MTQIGEGIAVAIDPKGNEKCVFCGEDHQDEKAASKTTFPRDMDKLKKEGREYTIANYASYYPGVDLPPLAKWEKDNKFGYKAAAHHCIALSAIDNHAVSGELKEAGYDPNRGSNCSWLPYSRLQFIRARAYLKPLQKHRGGHTSAYFEKVTLHVEMLKDFVEESFCPFKRKISQSEILEFMEFQEKEIWLGLANPLMESYYLYNHSYLYPRSSWGSYEEETGKSRSDIVDLLLSPEDDAQAEKESFDDPENIVKN